MKTFLNAQSITSLISPSCGRYWFKLFSVILLPFGFTTNGYVVEVE